MYLNLGLGMYVSTDTVKAFLNILSSLSAVATSDWLASSVRKAYVSALKGVTKGRLGLNLSLTCSAS